MAKTANEEFFDALIRHQIYLLRFSSTIQTRIINVLNSTERDLVEAINGVIGANSRLVTDADYKRLARLEALIKKIRDPAWAQSYDILSENMTGLAKSEALFMQSAVGITMPVILDTELPDARTLRAIALSRPFDGRNLRQWAQSMERSDLNRINSTIQSGMLDGLGSAQIARQVVGTARAHGIDGVTQTARNNIVAVTRTSVQHTASMARREFLMENADIVTQEQYTATLDARTTPACRGFDGQLFPLGKGPQPPVHMSCRSVRIAYFDGVDLGTRPAKPTTEKQMLNEFTAKNNLSRVTTRDALPYGTKGKFDRYSRNRIRQLVGPVPAETTYNDWLKTQSVEFQNDVLGVTKGKLFRDGNLPLSKFIDKSGNELTLSQLVQRDASAFTAAGLDPKEF